MHEYDGDYQTIVLDYAGTCVPLHDFTTDGREFEARAQTAPQSMHPQPLSVASPFSSRPDSRTPDSP